MQARSERAAVAVLEEAGAAMDGRYSVKPHKRVALTTYLYSVAERAIEGSSLLDIGCGHGVDAMAASLLGASFVAGIDVDDEGIDHMRSVLSKLRDRGLGHGLYCVKSDVAPGLPFEDRMFDVTFLIEAVSHIRCLDAVLREVLRVTKQGGVVVINDSNNPLSHGVKRRALKLWERWENGPRPGAEGLPVHQHSYRAMRQHMIQEAYPELGDGEAYRLSLSTTGMFGQQILATVETYRASGVMPDRRYEAGTCPISPTGCYMERLLDPYQLAERLQGVGFSRTRVMPHLTHGNRIRAFVDTLFRNLPSAIAMYMSRGYIVVAEK